jgi:hypothetical protein
MQIRDAILAAASHIERNPGEFSFFPNEIPRGVGCGVPGCAAGWVAYFHGSTMQRISGFLERVMDVSLSHFLHRMDTEFGFDNWHHSSTECAGCLRAYADKYHPARPLILPDWNAMAAVQTVGADESDQVFTP